MSSLLSTLRDRDNAEYGDREWTNSHRTCRPAAGLFAAAGPGLRSFAPHGGRHRSRLDKAIRALVGAAPVKSGK